MDPSSIKQLEIDRLIALSAAARVRMSDEAAILRQRLDIPYRIRGSLKEHPSAWMVASLASGMAANFLFRRKPALPKKTRGLSAVLLGIGLNALRPMAKIWLSNQVKQWIKAPCTPAPEARGSSSRSLTFKPL